MKNLATALSIALLAANIPAAVAQNYPGKPIRLVVTAGPGGGQDILARMIAPHLGERLGQAIVVENRVGATGSIGIESVARAPADGYTLLVGAAGPITALPMLTTKPTFDPLRDFVPITILASSPFALAVHPGMAAKSLKEFIALAKAKPGALNYGSSGIGGSPHLATELLSQMAEIRMVNIPYKGLAPAVTALVGGQLDIVIADLNLVVPHTKSGKLRLLAIASPTRSSAAPDIPTVSEAAVPGYTAGTWYGVLAPAGTSAAIVNRLHTEIAGVLKTSAMREQIAAQGSEPGGNTPAQFAALLRSETEKWRKLGETANIKLE